MMFSRSASAIGRLQSWERGNPRRPSAEFSKNGRLDALSVTSTIKDWTIAGDVKQRIQRRDALQARRGSFSLECGSMAKPISECHLARGPVADKLRPDIDHRDSMRHRKIAKQLYECLDKTRRGTVSLAELKTSFEALHVPLNEETFNKYVQVLLPNQSSDSITKQAFLEFHSAVWGSQAPAIHRYVGAAFAEAGTNGANLRTSRSAPSICTMDDLRFNESRLRKAFGQYADPANGRVGEDKLSDLLGDLGLPGCLPDAVQTNKHHRWPANGELTLHQVVNVVNLCIASYEEEKLSIVPTRAGQKLEAALMFAKEHGDIQDNHPHLCVQKTARFGSANSAEDLSEKARNALEHVLLNDHINFDGEDKQSLIEKAQDALERALLVHSDVDEESMLVNKARAALENTLLNEGGIGDDVTDQVEMTFMLVKKARAALENALFDESDGDMRDELEQGFILARKARAALENALLNENVNDVDQLRDELEQPIDFSVSFGKSDALTSKARDALNCALLGAG